MPCHRSLGWPGMRHARPRGPALQCRGMLCAPRTCAVPSCVWLWSCQPRSCWRKFCAPSSCVHRSCGCLRRLPRSCVPQSCASARLSRRLQGPPLLRWFLRPWCLSCCLLRSDHAADRKRLIVKIRANILVVSESHELAQLVTLEIGSAGSVSAGFRAGLDYRLGHVEFTNIVLKQGGECSRLFIVSRWIAPARARIHVDIVNARNLDGEIQIENVQMPCLGVQQGAALGCRHNGTGHGDGET